MEITIGGVKYTIKQPDAVTNNKNYTRCTDCDFFEPDVECPKLHTGGNLCRALECNGPVIFKKAPTFEDDVSKFIEANFPELEQYYEAQSGALKKFFSKHGLQEIAAIARKHKII